MHKVVIHVQVTRHLTLCQIRPHVTVPSIKPRKYYGCLALDDICSVSIFSELRGERSIGRKESLYPQKERGRFCQWKEGRKEGRKEGPLVVEQ